MGLRLRMQTNYYYASKLWTASHGYENESSSQLQRTQCCIYGDHNSSDAYTNRESQISENIPLQGCNNTLQQFLSCAGGLGQVCMPEDSPEFGGFVGFSPFN